MDNKFIDGLIFKIPERKPDYVVGKISIKKEDFISFISKLEGDWVNIDLLISKGNKPYAKLNDWKPNNNQQQAEVIENNNETEDVKPEDIPF